MENHIIIKEDGSRLPWKKTKDNKDFCLLYHDNNQKYVFTPQSDLKCQLFMIGGGGAGGYYFGGGGGAGAAYINNNFTFEKGKTYTFSIGTGGTCDICDFNKLFNSGLSLNVYNNTSPKLNNISFTYDDYSSLGIETSSIIQSYIVNDISINQNIFNTNTTYIWNGYIKSDSENIITIRFNSKIKTIMWIDNYYYTNKNAFISTSGETNIQEIKAFQLDPNKYYNIKIIAYNYDSSSNSNFNIDFVNCKFYNYNKNFENYNVVPATDTTLTFKNVSTTDNNVIACKGGGAGGFGLYNQNKDLNGGCGGGSGINKIKGISTINNPIYNGNDGAVGNYCGGGGGIISSGNNNNGGNGKILKWFDETLLFGAGGNGASRNDNGNNNGNDEKRNLGYGCGGNGGDCCYFSKSLINNNGNNGCILIYASTIEYFTTNKYELITNDYIKDVDYLSRHNDTIAAKLIEDSYKIAGVSDGIININKSSNNRKKYFDSQGLSFASLAPNAPTAGSTTNNDMYNFIYDILVISKLYTVSYIVLYNHFITTCQSNADLFAKSMSNLTITLSDAQATLSDISSSDIMNLNYIFNIDNLGLNNSKPKYDNENDIYVKASTGNSSIGCPNVSVTAFNNYKNDIKGENGYYVPLYHNSAGGAVINGLKSFITDSLSLINKIVATTNISNFESTNTSSNTNINIGFLSASSNITRYHIKSLYEQHKTTIENNKDKYSRTRILLYLEAFNIILNTNAYTLLLPMLKYQLYKYNSIIYNVSIQYQIFTLQNNRIKSDNYAAGLANTFTETKTNIDNDIKNLTANLTNIIEKNINTPSNTKDTVTEVLTIIDNQDSDKDDFNKNQLELNETINKYNTEFQKNNNILYYYKIVIIITIFLILLIFFIFTLKSIDINIKIVIFIILILLIIILLIYYNNTYVITENFVAIYNKGEIDTSKIYSTETSINFSSYRDKLSDYNNKIIKFITVATVNKNILSPISDFSRKINIVRKNKAEYYKLKKINLENALDILKKTSNKYYHLILLLLLSTLIILASLILLLIIPEMLIQIISVALIFLIILIYYISYNINKSTRLSESKNYWANYNPSKATLDAL